MAKKRLLAEPTTKDLVEKIVTLQNRARKLYAQIDPLLNQVTARLNADPNESRVFEIDGVQYEWSDRFAGERHKVRVDQYIARYTIAASR